MVTEFDSLLPRRLSEESEIVAGLGRRAREKSNMQHEENVSFWRGGLHQSSLRAKNNVDLT